MEWRGKHAKLAYSDRLTQTVLLKEKRGGEVERPDCCPPSQHNLNAAECM